ncbi:MAG TPA: DUF885 family protein [Pirellulales bacterium]|nr:DUF885 family protein [Pirellulales bacterium]
MPRCTACGKKNLLGFTFCQKCGAPLEAVDDEAPETATPSERPAADDASASADATEEQISQLLEQGDKIEAINLYRQRTGLGLAEAKRAVERMQVDMIFAESDIEEQLLALLRQERKIAAIKFYRQRTHSGLKEAKEAIEALAAKHGLVTRRAGCASMFLLALLTAASIAVTMPTVLFADDDAFDQLAKQYVDEFPALHPVAATQIGDHRFDDQVDDVSEASRRREIDFCKGYLDRLASIPRDELSRKRQVDAELLAHNLRSTVWQLERLQEWAWNPLMYTGLAGDAVYGLVAREFAPEADRLRNVTKRLEALPNMLAQVRDTLDPPRVPTIHAETAVKQNRGVLSIIRHMVEPRLSALAAAERERLARAIETARRAIEKHQQWLEDELTPAASGEFRLGKGLFDEKLAFTLQSPLSRDEIHDRAVSELGRVREEMWEIAREVYRKQNPYTRFPDQPDDSYKQAIIRAAIERACGDLPAPDRIVETAREALVRCTDFVRENDLVTIPPDPIEIIEMPEFRRGIALAYCDSPGPLDVGQKTFYAVAPLPVDWTREQVTSFLREYNVRSIHDLTVHEAMPGHFLQLAISNRYPSTLRAVLSSGVFIEGWAVYCEQLMAEQGFLDGDPLLRLVALKWYLRSIANAIIDQAIHVDGMSREEALELMIESTFQEEREAAAKWVRAQLTSTQLSTYFVGYQEHRDLRAEAQRAWGREFTLKRYHDRVISFGSPPVQFARALLLDLEVPSAAD